MIEMGEVGIGLAQVDVIELNEVSHHGMDVFDAAVAEDFRHSLIRGRIAEGAHLV